MTSVTSMNSFTHYLISGTITNEVGKGTELNMSNEYTFKISPKVQMLSFQHVVMETPLDLQNSQKCKDRNV